MILEFLSQSFGIGVKKKPLSVGLYPENQRNTLISKTSSIISTLRGFLYIVLESWKLRPNYPEMDETIFNKEPKRQFDGPD